MKFLVFAVSLLLFHLFNTDLHAQNKLDTLLPVRSLCIAAPKPAKLNSFVDFINKELGSRSLYTLVLRLIELSNQKIMQDRFQGMMQTVWSGPEPFLEGFKVNKTDDSGGENTPWHSFKSLNKNKDSLKN